MATAPELMADADLKLEWADKHIEKFELEIQLFHKRDSYELFKEEHSDGNLIGEGDLVGIGNPPPIPPQLILIACDAVHNMRAALDYFAGSLAIANNSTPNGVGFPIAGNVDKFPKALEDGKIHKLSPAAKDFIVGLKPYKGGNNMLWAIHEIDRQDKHQKLVLFAPTEPMAYFEYLVSENKGPENVISLAPKAYLKSLGLLPAFGDIEGFERDSALTLLKEFSSCVYGILIRGRSLFLPGTRSVKVFA